ncbi:MAG: hypothetical protein WD049_03095 [Candidatus Paceibacterota bacterium]
MRWSFNAIEKIMNGFVQDIENNAVRNDAEADDEQFDGRTTE